jgi:hypothetical protein
MKDKNVNASCFCLHHLQAISSEQLGNYMLIQINADTLSLLFGKNPIGISCNSPGQNVKIAFLVAEKVTIPYNEGKYF